MISKFAQSVIKELNNFRNNPKSIQHQCEVIRKGFSRLKAGDPFLNEIDYFIKALDSMKKLSQLELNDVLCEAAKKNSLISVVNQVIKNIEELIELEILHQNNTSVLVQQW